MSISDDATAAGDYRWYRELNGYQWFVFLVATLGWLFDTMDQQLFNLARRPAVVELLARTPDAPPTAGDIDFYAGVTTSIFILGWATGGIFFGILGDKIGRAKTMILTILTYSAFTGLSALSHSVWDFAAFRFLTGLGVGGQFSVGVSLVAESVSDRARPHALGWLQALSAVGNISAAVIGMGLGAMEGQGAIGSAWRAMFLVGLLPSLLALPVFFKLKEPERWKAAVREEEQEEASGEPVKKLGSIAELFSDPRWRRHTIVGMLLAFSGVAGLWGIGVFSNDLSRIVLRKHFVAAGLSDHEIAGKMTFWAGMTLLMFNVGGFFGVQAYAKASERIGRKPAFAISFVLAALATSISFWLLDEFWHIFVLVPLTGFCQLTLFGGYAIYFPELFPTRLRSTGVSFCYNVARYMAAAGPLAQGYLASSVFKNWQEAGLRYAGVAMCAVFVVGLLALPFAPETKGQPLPE